MYFNYELWALDYIDEWDLDTDEQYTVEEYRKVLPKDYSVGYELITLNTDVLFAYHDDNKGIRHSVIIPKGFQFDGASIPPKFWSIIGKPTDWKFRNASLVHDFMYGCGKQSRKHADLLFRQILKDSGVWTLKAEIMYKAVRLGGFLHFSHSGVEECVERWKEFKLKNKEAL